MNGPAFDRLAHALGERDSRRGWLRSTAGLVAATTAARATPPVAASGVTAARKHRSTHPCGNDQDCAKCHWCVNRACERKPNGSACGGGNVCKKGHCHVGSPKLRVNADAPCVTATASGLKPGSACQFQLSSPCYPGGGAGTEGGPDGTAVLPENCGNCTLFWPGTQDTSITVEARGTAAKTNKHCKLTETVDNVACVSLP